MSLVGISAASHLLQMRGLKQMKPATHTELSCVASFTDAWIETVLQNLSVKRPESHLLQMRGLKLFAHPLSGMSKVASFTDAWIETARLWRDVISVLGRIFYRCVD